MSGTLTSVSGSPVFDYAEGQPNLFLLMKYKQALVAEHGIERGFEIYRHALQLPISTQLKQVDLASDREFAATHALHFAETAPAGISFENQPPLVIGEGNHYPLSGVTRSQFVACISDARVVGRSSAIQCAGRLLSDFQPGERDRLDDELEWDPVIFHASGVQAQVISGFHDPITLEFDEAFTLLGSHTDFFGHWMVEYLPKLVAARLSGELPPVTMLIDSCMPPSHRQSLELLYGPDVQLVEIPAFKAVSVKKLWLAPTLMYMPLHERRNERFRWDDVAAPAERVSRVNEEMRRLAAISLGTSSHPSGRVFLARKAFRHRKLLNTTRIEELAQAGGFSLAYPEDLSFAEQVDLLRTARFVIAPEGSALFLTFFSPPGAKVCVLSHPLTDVLADFNALLTPVGVDLCAFTGAIHRLNASTPHDSDYEIDAAAFSAFLENWLSV